MSLPVVVISSRPFTAPWSHRRHLKKGFDLLSDAPVFHGEYRNAIHSSPVRSICSPLTGTCISSFSVFTARSCSSRILCCILLTRALGNRENGPAPAVEMRRTMHSFISSRSSGLTEMRSIKPLVSAKGVGSGFTKAGVPTSDFTAVVTFDGISGFWRMGERLGLHASAVVLEV